MNVSKSCSLEELRRLVESRSLSGIPVEGHDAFRIVTDDAPLHMVDALDRMETVLRRGCTDEERVRIARAHRRMFWPTVVLFWLGKITAPLLRLAFLLLEMGVAYAAARWLDPEVQRRLSFEAAFVVLFLIGDLLLAPVQAKAKNGMYWALCRRRLSVLERLLTDVEEAVGPGRDG